MQITVLNAKMDYSKENGYVGQVEFSVDGHSYPYEITLHSKYKKDWTYGLHFLKESGKEEDISALEEELEESDEVFDLLVEAAMQTLASE
ncbi:MAG: hypothetical protein A2189_09690 [Paenibacillus sp. RIFOXYA1_FULL_44_5]|nr:MAG: hypothetical protein A2189_09690 [Paenibacillus sp. RIFOXYA1_FULL_44_5]